MPGVHGSFTVYPRLTAAKRVHWHRRTPARSRPDGLSKEGEENTKALADRSGRAMSLPLIWHERLLLLRQRRKANKPSSHLGWIVAPSVDGSFRAENQGVALASDPVRRPVFQDRRAAVHFRRPTFHLVGAAVLCCHAVAVIRGALELCCCCLWHRCRTDSQ